MFLRSIITFIGTFFIAAESIELPDLPYAYDALSPVISEITLRTHHLKHHAKYVNTANQILKDDKKYANLTPEKIIQDRSIRASNPILFNNVAQSWNHAFYWKCLTPVGGGGMPSGILMDMIKRDFGSYEEFRKKMESEALACFGSGWAWLGYDSNRGQEKLVVMKTSGADNPLAFGVTPLLTIDVWEHAYYLDYQEKRNEYVDAFFSKLVHWAFAEENLNRVVTTRDEL
ncbi:hypothetical protein ACHAWX_000341 [Stephanocyclus meneghinianus]